MDGERISDCADPHSENHNGDVSECYPLLEFWDLPDYLKANEYILKYYRSDFPFRRALGSLFTIHNETINIWTHLAGFLIFVGLTAYTAVSLPKMMDFSVLPSLENLHSIVEENFTNLLDPFSHLTESKITRWPFFVFLCGAMICLLLSSTFHLLSCHSKRWYNTLQRLDHAGIAILIVASFYPPVYYSFMCHPELQIGYLFSLTALGLLTIVFASLPKFRTPEFRNFRTLAFSAIGLSGVVPGLHGLIIHKDDPAAFHTIGYEVAMGCLYGAGALLYVWRIPERWKPGFFDVVGHSHQMFHILVVVAAYVHYEAGLLYMTWRETRGCVEM